MSQDRRAFLQGAGAAIAMTAVSAIAQPVRRKNVLFIAVDDLRPSIGCYGDTFAITPNMDSLAREGVRFSHAYCQQAVCNPSRQSLMTGLRPDTIRVWDLKTHFRKTSPGIKSLPELFRDQGYFAQSFGKIYHGEAPMADPPSWSVPEQFEYTPKHDDYRLERNHVHRVAEKGDVSEWVEAEDDDYPDGKVAKAAVAAMETFALDRSKPFFLAVGMRKPHLPFTGPRRYWDMFAKRSAPEIEVPQVPEGAPALALHNSVELRGYLGVPAKGAIPPQQVDEFRRGYYAAMSYTDAQIGRVLGALKRTGLDRDTIIVFWADHGFHLGEHGLWAKTTNYERDTRVPLIVVDPSHPHRNATCHAIVELIDIFPTVCEMCGLVPPPRLEGKSLVPWLHNPHLEKNTIAHSQFPRPWFYQGEPEHMGYTVRTRKFRYVEWRKFGTHEVVARELYNMVDGKDEDRNLASESTMKNTLDRLSRSLMA